MHGHFWSFRRAEHDRTYSDHPLRCYRWPRVFVYVVDGPDGHRLCPIREVIEVSLTATDSELFGAHFPVEREHVDSQFELVRSERVL